MSIKRKIISETRAGSCYFRTSVKYPYRKALLQITEQCNLHCAHCFVSSTEVGNSFSYDEIERMISQFNRLNIITVTITGGEPFMHKEIVEIVKLFRHHNIQVSLCSNGTLITEENARQLATIGNVKINISLDGFDAETHGKFRGDKNSFEKTRETVKLLRIRYMNLLKGILVTPNVLSNLEEYSNLCRFAIENEAEYVLMNPLSNFGRGIKSKNSLEASTQMMNDIYHSTQSFQEFLDMVYIRFPNKNSPCWDVKLEKLSIYLQMAMSPFALI